MGQNNEAFREERVKPPSECVNCKKDYPECQKCPVHKRMNAPCDFCGKPNAKPFIRATAKGLVSSYACDGCIARLT